MIKFLIMIALIEGMINLANGTTLSLAADPFRYNGQYTDVETKNHQYLINRYYNPELMRFISRDSFDLLNRYAYAEGNPVMNADPSGHLATKYIISSLVGAASMIALGSGAWYFFRRDTVIEEEPLIDKTAATANLECLAPSVDIFTIETFETESARLRSIDASFKTPEEERQALLKQVGKESRARSKVLNTNQQTILQQQAMPKEKINLPKIRHLPEFGLGWTLMPQEDMTSNEVGMLQKLGQFLAKGKNLEDLPRMDAFHFIGEETRLRFGVTFKQDSETGVVFMDDPLTMRKTYYLQNSP